MPFVQFDLIIAITRTAIRLSALVGQTLGGVGVGKGWEYGGGGGREEGVCVGGGDIRS